VALYGIGRGGYEVWTVTYPEADRIRRDQVGGSLVTEYSSIIGWESYAHSVDANLVKAVIRHESAAFERRLLTLWPSVKPGQIADAAETLQSVLQGETASIGPGQMQLRRAKELEEMGYVAARGSDSERRQALLSCETAAEYVAGMLQYVSDQLQTLEGYGDLTVEQQQRLVLVAYNWGWTSDFRDEIAQRGLQGVIEFSSYDNQTLDEYLRWSSEQ
jgi:hypothetical protein